MNPILVGSGSQGVSHSWNLSQTEKHEEKKVAVQEEMKRMNQLPPTSTYASHRLRVLNKILHLLSLQRTTSQDEELELLFSGLHL